MSSLSDIHNLCHQIFKKGFFEIDNGKDNLASRFLYPSNACRIYDKLTDGDAELQDCIGENFNTLIINMDSEWFENYKPGDKLDYYFFNYILQLYLFVERVDLVFDVINKDGKSKIFSDFQVQNFKILRKINKWANFIKHPKEFLFTHWPFYYIEGEDVVKNDGDTTIDTDFIFNHYFREGNPRPLILENNNRVFVEIPNLEILTKEFCNEMNVFFNFICANQIVADFLKKKSTISYMYDDLNISEKAKIQIDEL